MGLYCDIITVQEPQSPPPQPYLVPESRTGKSTVKDNVFFIILFPDKTDLRRQHYQRLIYTVKLIHNYKGWMYGCYYLE